jgi:ribosome maturation factor RimP
MAKIEENVLKLAEPVAADHHCEVVDCEFKKEGNDWYLRVFIDKDGGVGINDCEAVSRELSDVLDRENPISQAYLFEVCSPGLERELKKEREFNHFLGRKVSVKLYAPYEGRKEFTAILEDYKDETAFVRTEEGDLLEIKKTMAAYIRLYAEF